MRTKNPAGLLVTLARALGWLDAPGTAVRSRFRLYAFARERRDNMLRMDDAKLLSWIEIGPDLRYVSCSSPAAGAGLITWIPPGERLPVFSAQAAPVQIAMPVYPGTTGVRQIGFKITDS